MAPVAKRYPRTGEQDAFVERIKAGESLIVKEVK